jgi:hypothetical protein
MGCTRLGVAGVMYGLYKTWSSRSYVGYLVGVVGSECLGRFENSDGTWSFLSWFNVIKRGREECIFFVL